MRHHAAFACLLGLLVLSASEVRAQQGVLRGIVVDSTGTAIEEAAVSVLALKIAIRTDARGRFTLDRLAPGPIELAVRRLGFEPRTVKVTLTTAPVDSVRIVLNELPEVLSAINISANERHRRQMVEDFYFRRARGIGKYVTREEILAQRASTITDVLRMTPGIRIVRTRTGLGVRFTAVSNMRNTNCLPTVWVDGQRLGGMEIDDLPLNDIEGLELYGGASTTPAQFWQGNTANCGTIVVWTRVPGTP